MKEFDFVELVSSVGYLEYNLSKGMYGIVMEIKGDEVDVLFFNPKNTDYAVARVKEKDIKLQKEKIPNELKKEFMLKKQQVLAKAKGKIELLEINEYDIVELLVEDEKYAKYGIHKGETGCVVEDYAVDDCVLVDFSGIDNNGEYYGDYISVNIKDLKVIKKTR